MNIAIAGYNGFIGKSYIQHRKDVEFVRIPRSVLYGETELLSKTLMNCDVVLNLAGAPIARRWTHKYKKEIEKSRNLVNRNLVKAINRLNKKPKYFLSASAIGIYKSEGMHNETSFVPDDHYLAAVVRGWEVPLEDLDHEVKQGIIRIGVVLGKEGGALVPLLRLSKMGVLPILGSGKQFFSFIHLTDLMKAIDFIVSGELTGIFNLCSPFPVDNATFTKLLAQITATKVVIRIPSLFIKIGLGEAHIMVTGGPYVLPARLTGEGFRFTFQTAGEALENLLMNLEESH